MGCSSDFGWGVVQQPWEAGGIFKHMVLGCMGWLGALLHLFQAEAKEITAAGSLQVAAPPMVPLARFVVAVAEHNFLHLTATQPLDLCHLCLRNTQPTVNCSTQHRLAIHDSVG